jgi:hypothetical protein
VKKITAALLRRKHACSMAVEKFEAMWPHGVYPTVALADALNPGMIPIYWMEDHLLSRAGVRKVRASVRYAERKYEDEIVKAREAFEEQKQELERNTILTKENFGRNYAHIRVLWHNRVNAAQTVRDHAHKRAAVRVWIQENS